MLQVDHKVLINLVANGVVTPVESPENKSADLWGTNDIFRAYVGMHLINEFQNKYGMDFDHIKLKYEQVNSDLLRTIRSKGKEIRKSEEWKEVAKRAAEHGLFFKEEY